MSSPVQENDVDKTKEDESVGNVEGEDVPLIQQEKKVAWWQDFKPYSSYVLFLLLLAYLFNQLDRYTLAITIKPVAQELEFGDKGCLRNDSISSHHGLKCNGTSEDTCVAIVTPNGSHYCKWDFNGQGWDFQVLVGPVFIVIYTFTGIFVGFAADVYNRKNLLAICLIGWSLMTLLSAFVHEYWQLALLRFGLGLWEAGCTPFAASLIADYFSEISRGAAFGVYNFGIYLGYSLSYAVGNFITSANINGQGWRWAFILPAIPGVLVGFLILFTVKEPARRKLKLTQGKAEDGENIPLNAEETQRKVFSLERLKIILRPFLSPSLLLLCIAGSIRNAGGYVWGSNTESYFDATNVSHDTIGKFMSWIPLVGGCLGVFFGGFISDRIIKNRGLYARIFVLVISQIVAAPFAAGALFLDSPYAFISLIPSNLVGEMWVGVTLAVGVELVPANIRTSYVAVYLFIITNIGGNVPLLVPPIQKAFENRGYTKAQGLRGALYILFPGLYLLSSVFFLFTLFVVKRDQKRAQANVAMKKQDDEPVSA